MTARPTIRVGEFCDCCCRLMVLLMPVRYDEDGELTIAYECLSCRLDYIPAFHHREGMRRVDERPWLWRTDATTRNLTPAEHLRIARQAAWRRRKTRVSFGYPPISRPVALRLVTSLGLTTQVRE